MLVSGSKDKSIKVWDIASGKELFTLNGHENTITDVKFSKDDRFLISGSLDGSMRFWDINSKTQKVSFIGFNDNEYIAITPKGYYLSSKLGSLHQKVMTSLLEYKPLKVFKSFNFPNIIKKALSGREILQKDTLQRAIKTKSYLRSSKNPLF
jgi:WD40 repeat protein